MSRRTRAWCWANCSFMTFIWVTRIKNAAGDHTQTSAEHALAYTLSGICLCGAVALAAIAWRRSASRAVTWALVAVPAVHIGIWVVRGVQIATDDRALSFKAVHVTLGIISVVLAVALIRSVRSSPPWDNRSASSRSTPSAVGSSASS